jgi:hypothetical protein
VIVKTILLLKEKTEAANAIRSNLPRLATKERDAIPGCTSDRWGHPCADCLDRKKGRLGRPEIFVSKKMR